MHWVEESRIWGKFARATLIEANSKSQRSAAFCRSPTFRPLWMRRFAASHCHRSKP